MRIVKLLSAVAALSLIAACGGGGGGDPTPTPTPTTPAEQAASVTAIDAGQGAAGEGALNGFQQFLPDMGAMALKAQAEGLTKASETKNINLSDQPCGYDEDSGTYSVTGTMIGSCSVALPNISCTADSSSMNITFSNCKKSADISDTQYSVVINGSATATLSGTISGTLVGEDFTPGSASFSGTLGGTVDVSGDAVGTVDLTGIGYSGSGTGEEVDITCSGACTVALDGLPEAVCGIATTCDGCTE